MIRKKSLICILLLASMKLAAQTVPQFSQYIFNGQFLNPAMAGTQGRTNIQSIIRSQYTGYSSDLYPGGANTATVFSADMPLTKLKGGIGIYVSNNQFSKIQSKQDFVISYSYQKRISNNIIGVGVGIGANALKLNYTNYKPRDAEDPIIAAQNQSFLSPAVNLGIYLQNPVYSIGISAKNILPVKYNNNSITGSISEKPSYYITGKYDFGISYTLDISPMMNIKTDLNQVSTELGVLASYNQKYWGGINYRWQDAIGLLIGANVLNNNIKIGYALDYVVLGTEAKAPLSHEIFLRYALAAPRFGKKTIIKTPRYNF